jgi:hypothetical protein
MVLTRKECKQAFEHLIDNVLGMDDESLKQGLSQKGSKDLFCLLGIELSTIDGLKYNRSSTEEGVYVPAGTKSIIKALLSYISHCQNRGELN